MHMATAEWLIRGMLSLCNEGRELDRSETLILKTNGKLGFGSKEGNIDRGELLRWSSTKES